MTHSNLRLALLFILASPCTQAAGDINNGQVLYTSRCIACHSVDANRVGPSHRGVFGRKAGSVDGYDYSTALKNSSIIWTRETLNQWLENPQALIPGQKMGYSVPDAQDREDLISYLQSLSTPTPR